MIVTSLTEPPVHLLPLEIVERKGIGHPDTICDALAEEFSRALCRFYLERFGFILHHNVDKGLLFAGRTEPAFGGGRVLEPFEVFLVGRATTEFRGVVVPVEDLAREAAYRWFKAHFHALNPEKHVRLKVCVRPGSPELVELFLKAQQKGVPLANDTSVGVGYAPLSPLEKLVKETEKYLNAPSFHAEHPALGQDIKVMGVREGDRFRLTVACAMVGKYVSDPGAYWETKERLINLLKDRFSGAYPGLEIALNAADDPEKGDIYLTVTGTSAEAGDDGEVGRGNRVNGLITPLRPMSLEAACGKNPISHVGKIYNFFAQQTAEKLVSEIEELKEAYVFLVSRIGSPINEPQTILLKLRAEGDFSRVSSRARELVKEELETIPSYYEKIVSSVWPCC